MEKLTLDQIEVDCVFSTSSGPKRVVELSQDKALLTLTQEQEELDYWWPIKEISERLEDGTLMSPPWTLHPKGSYNWETGEWNTEL